MPDENVSAEAAPASAPLSLNELLTRVDALKNERDSIRTDSAAFVSEYNARMAALREREATIDQTIAQLISEQGGDKAPTLMELFDLGGKKNKPRKDGNKPKTESTRGRKRRVSDEEFSEFYKRFGRDATKEHFGLSLSTVYTRAKGLGIADAAGTETYIPADAATGDAPVNDATTGQPSEAETADAADATTDLNAELAELGIPAEDGIDEETTQEPVANRGRGRKAA